MKKYRSFLLAIASLSLGSFASAQQPLTVDTAALVQHVQHRAPLVYPATAKAAQVQGTVVVEVQIDSTGHLSSIKPVSGPPMLIGAAVDCVKQWIFRPFLKGDSRVPVAGQISLQFNLGQSIVGDGPAGAPRSTAKVIAVQVKSSLSDAKIARPYLKAWGICSHDVMAQEIDGETVSACHQAADLAAQFPRGQDFIGMHAVDDYAATSFMKTSDLKSALLYANRGVDMAKVDPTDAPDNSTAYGIRAKVEALSGNLAGADQDLRTAEALQRKFVALLLKYNPTMVPREHLVLSGMLQFHAQVLQKMGRNKEAQKKLDEAAEL